MLSLSGYRALVAVVFITLTHMPFTAPAAGADGERSANILIYHRFGETRYPSTNIRLEQFDSHLEALQRGGYQVMPLIEIVRRLKQKLPLPDRAIAITIDDAYASVATEAWPRLRDRGLPATLFVATDPVDQNLPGYLDWETIRALKREGLSIGHHGAAHIHMPKSGVADSRADISRASARFRDELNDVPRVFAYPFGEFDIPTRALVEEMGFMAALAQYSSPAQWESHPYSLPRFALNEAYGTADRFRLVAGARALPVSDVLPASPIIGDDNNPPLFGFSVDPSGGGLDRVNCFPSHMSEAADILRPGPRRIEVRFSKPFPKGRNRINCTIPVGDGRFYWFGGFFLRPGAEE